MVKGQKQLCLESLEKYINTLDEQAEEAESFDFGTVEIGYTFLKMLHGVISAQDVKEPMEDIVFFAGMPEMDSPCYHILVRPEDLERMQKDPYIHMVQMKKFSGVMEQDNKPKKKLVYTDKNHAFCGGCGARMYPRYRPSSCRKCGTLVDYSGEWWYKSTND